MTHTLEELIPDYIQGLPAYVAGKPVEEVEQEAEDPCGEAGVE